MKKRFLALLLVLTLVFSLMPAALAADAADPTGVTGVTGGCAVTFQLHTDTDDWIQPTTVANLPEGATVFEVFRQVLAAEGYTYECSDQYCYVQAVTAPDGTRVAELSKGQNSGWLFRVNGDIPDVAMDA